MFEYRVSFGVEARSEAHDADTDPLERITLEANGEILSHRIGFGGGGIGRIAAGHRAEQDRRVHDISRHRPCRVLAVADRHDIGSRHQPDGRLQPDKPVDGRRTGNGTVCFGAHRPRG